MSANPQLQTVAPVSSDDEARGDAESKVVSLSAAHAYRHLADALDNIGGLDIAAGVTGMDRGDLRKAIDRTIVGSGVRRVPLEHAMAIGARLSRYNTSLATRLASAMVYPLGFEVFPRVVISDKSRADAYEDVIRRMPYGDQIIADIRSGGRR